jgi:hypothetical protein
MATPQPQAAVPKKVEPGTAAETVPLDTQTPLAPTHALSITHTKHHTILIQDLTPFLSSLFSPSTGLAIEEATKLIDGTPAPPTLYTLKKENLLGSHMTVHDKEGKEVAEWKNPILSLHAGKVTIKFLDGEAGQKTVEVNSIGHDRISEVCLFPFFYFLLQFAQVFGSLHLRFYLVTEIHFCSIICLFSMAISEFCNLYSCVLHILPIYSISRCVCSKIVFGALEVLVSSRE